MKDHIQSRMGIEDMKVASNNMELGCSSDGRTVWMMRVRGNVRVFVRRKRRSESIQQFITTGSARARSWFTVNKEE